MDFLDRIRNRAAARRTGSHLGARIGKALCFSQDDLAVANAAGATVRADINAQLQALGTRMSGASAPATTYAHMLWVDTTNGVLKRRNAANSGWIVVDTIDETFVLSRSSNTILDVSDHRKTIRATGSYTQTFDAVATLGDGWEVDIRVEASVTLTLDPNSTETIDGATTLAIEGPWAGKVKCNGSALYTVGGPLIATQAQMEAGSSLAAMVTAARQHLHPSAAKAACLANTSGGNNYAYNCGSPTDSGTGDITIQFDTDFSSASFAVCASILDANTTIAKVNALAVGTARIFCLTLASALADPTVGYSVIAFGDQA